MTYLTDEEKKMPDDLIRLQLALGTQSCDTQGEVSELFKEYGDLRVAKYWRRCCDVPFCERESDEA